MRGIMNNIVQNGEKKGKVKGRRKELGK